MKKRFTRIMAALALLVFMAPSMVAVGQTRTEVVAYTLEPVATGSNSSPHNSYTAEATVTIDNIEWAVTGNSYMVPWRIGGKSITTGVDRTLYSKTAISDNISKIEVTHGAASSITVNSWTIIVSANSDFSNPVSTLTPTFEANTTTTINRPDGADWSNCYYKFVYNVTVSGSSNKFIEFTRAKFYKETSTNLQDSDLSLSPTALTFDLYNDANAKTITISTSSTGAISVSNNAYVTTQVNGVASITVTPVAVTPEAQTITVSQAADNTYNAGEATFTVSITNTTPTYTVTYKANGGTGDDVVDTYFLGDNVTVRSNPFIYTGHAFTKWNTAANGNGTDYQPAATIENIQANVELYAQWEESNEVVDVLTNSNTIGETTSSYGDWTATGTSGAEYSGNSAGSDETIQLRSNNSNSGIVSTVSGGLVKKVVVTWHSETITGRTLNVYGNNTAYTDASDLYGNNAGTLLGTIVCGTSTELTITDDYEFIGLRSASGAMYLEEIRITWEPNNNPAVATTTTINVPSDFNTDIYTSTSAGTLTATVSAEGTPISGATVTWSSSNTDVATIDANNGAVTLVAVGTTTITASYAGVTDQYRPSTDTYELEVTDSTPIGDLVIDFESATTAYTNWTFTNMTSQQTGSITAHGGDYYGTTGGKTSASITTNLKIATPYTLTCYVSKQSDNTTASTWYIQVSSDGTTWTDVASRSAIDMNKGEWKEFSANLTEYTDVYVRVYYNGNSSTAVRNIDDLTLLTTVPSVIAPTFSPAEGLYTSAQNVTISTTTPGATIYYTLDGTDPTTSSSVYSSPINVSSTTTIKAMAVASGNESSIVSATYTIELPLSTMDQIFAKATEVGSTETTVHITLGDWIVTGANTSSHTFVSDGTKGFMIYGSNHGFSAGDILSGTVECKVLLYNGAAEITQLTSNTTGLTVTTGGTATVANIALADLTGINTGALVSYHNLTCEAREEGSYTNYYLSDGTTEIQAYKTLLNDYANYLEDGKTYNITGVFVLNNETKRINPRSADDIVELVPTTITLDITGYGNNTGNYYFIASPVAENITPSTANGFISDHYDLFYWDEPAHTWRNHKLNAGFDIENGKGYLYANKTNTTLTFTGTTLTVNSKDITLSKQATTAHGGWNLIGNPFAEDANIDQKPFYRMNADGSDVITTTVIGQTISAMEGVFVIANNNNEVVTFTKGAASSPVQQLALNITQGRSEAIDRAIVRFDEGQELPKFQLNPNHTKLYIPQSEDDYAVVRAATDGVMPLNFKAESDGNYTISINTENVELNTLVLIDNLTGNEVNLLSRAEYSFDATTDDDENRFTLVYSKSGETKTYKLTITGDDFNTTSYAANNTEKTSNAVNVDDPTDTYEVVWASNQVMKNTSGQMQWQKGNGRIYNITNMGSITDVTVDGISGGFTTYYGESIEPAWSGITGQPFFQTKTYDDAVGYSTSLEVTFDIEEGAATTYSVTFDAGEGTFVGNEDFPNTENTKAAGIYTLPDATREGYVFNGWLATGTTTPRTGSYTVYTDVEFTAQYTENGASGGNGGTDVLDLEFTGVSGTNYTSWSDKEGESGAVYAGNSAGGNSAIQLRSSNNNSGIITTASGGMISKVVVTWNENTTNGRVLNVYGKNTAYTAVTDLYNSSKQGTLLGTITCGTSTELLVSDEYTFIGLRSNSGAMYIDEISITWVLPSNVATPTFSPAAGTYMGTQTVTISCETDGAVIYYTTDGSTPDNTSEVYDGGITVSQTTTIQAIAYVGTEASHVATATYTIVVPQTIAEVREQGTGTVLTYGVVTAVSTNSNGTTAYMQDMTAAIVVYGDFTAEVGDEIQVSGTLTTFRGLLEIGTPTVTVASQNNVIDPTVMTIAEIIEDAEGDNEYQAMLVSIVEATVTEINGNNTIIAQGENTITVYGSLGDVEEDDVISFTGNIGCYNTVQIVNPTNIEIQGNTTMPTFFIDGDWFDGANWTTGEVPAAGSNVTIAANATVNDGYIAVVNEMNITSEGSLTIADGGQVKSNTSFVANLQKNITGYGNGTGKYYLITVPASVDMCSVDGFMPMDNTLHTQVDFYAFDQQHEGEEWLNYKYGYDYFAGPYVTHRGVGYLYANKNNTTLNFASVGYSVPQGSTVNYYESPFQPTNVDFNAEIDYNSGVVFAGYNLLGNPFTCNAYLVGNYQFYRMNPDGDAIIAANPGDEIKPGEGIFVVVSSVDDEIIFTAEEPVLNKSCLAINLSDGQSLKDRAIVRFDEDRNIGKFMFNENGAKLYITQDGKDCSVVGSEGIGEMPVNFKAAQNGTYTLSFSNDNVEFSYLHLIDNMTGAEVDLLANPSYSFEAKSSDYASRFKLVFVVNEDNLNNNDNFAFVSNGNIVINGEGTLQVIDMTGRIVSVEEVNGMSSVNVNAAGVYVLQLTNGESVKTQKIVVK